MTRDLPIALAFLAFAAVAGLAVSSVGATFPNFSPDSKHLVYSFPVADALEQFINNVDGTGQSQLTTFGANSVCMPSAWSPDGKWISFRRTDERCWSIKERMLKISSEKAADKRPVRVIRPDGSEATPLEPLGFQMTIDGSRASWKPLTHGTRTIEDEPGTNENHHSHRGRRKNGLPPDR
jgi:hypothetical protein